MTRRRVVSLLTLCIVGLGTAGTAVILLVNVSSENPRTTGRSSPLLLFYDFSAPEAVGPDGERPGNVIPPDPDVRAAIERPYRRLYDAVKRAQQFDPECARKASEQVCTHEGQFYLFDEQTLEPVNADGTASAGSGAGPATERHRLFPGDDRKPQGAVIEEVPQGFVVLRQEPATDHPGTGIDESASVSRGWYLLRDRPELSGEDICDPEQQFDPITNSPNVIFDFTGEGAEAFEKVTRRIAERGQANAPPGVVNSEQAALFSHTFAVVLGDEIVSRPIINFLDNPAGIAADNGGQLSGSFTINEAQELAEYLAEDSCASE